MNDVTHRLGLLLGTENDWPSVFEGLIRRVGAVTDSGGTMHRYDVERVTIEPFDLRAKPSYDLVIDRLAYWYYHPREWLKKVALMDDVYLLNSPFTFQAMEKHAAYCAMMRLGLKIPDTVLVPYKNPLDHAKYAYTAERYNRPFDLESVAAKVGYPLFMKPYDGGAWRGVSRIRDADELNRAYDESGEMLMHLQASVEGYDVFARSLSIGAETMVMKFDPDQPMHGRYSVSHDFLSPDIGGRGPDDRSHRQRVLPVGVQLLRDVGQGRRGLPDRLCQRLPRRRHHVAALLLPVGHEGAGQVVGVRDGDRPADHAVRRPCSLVHDRRPRRPVLRRQADAYRAMADDYFDTERYLDFCASRLGDIDEIVLEYIESADFDRVLVETVTTTFPPHEHEQFVAHYRGLLGAWATDERRRLG